MFAFTDSEVDKIIPMMRKPGLGESTDFSKPVQFLNDFSQDFNLALTDSKPVFLQGLMLTKPCIGQETTQGAQASLRCRSHIGGPGCLCLSACFSSDSPWADAILVLIFGLDRTFRHQLSRVSSLEVADGRTSQPPQSSDQALTMNLCPLLSLPLAWRNVTDTQSIL